MPRLSHSKEISIKVSLGTIKLGLPGCSSLKEKRSILRPLLTRLHKEYNVSVSEIGLQDIWQSTWIGAVILSNDANHNDRLLNKLVDYIDSAYPEFQVEEYHIENY